MNHPNVHYIYGSELIREAKSDLTNAESREWCRIVKEESTMWRNFWIKVLHRKGHSNATIAKECEISESTVRKILKP